MPNNEDIPIILHFLQFGSGVRGSFVARLSDIDVELLDVGLVDVGPIEATTPVFVPADDSEWMVSMLMRRQQEDSYFIAAVGSGTFSAGVFGGGTFE